MKKPVYPCCLAVFCFSTGIIVGRFWGVPFVYLGYGLLLLFFLNAFLLRRKYVSQFFLLLLIFLFGIFWTQVRLQASADDISRLSYEIRRQMMMVEGKVASEVEYRQFFKRQKTMFVVEVLRVKIGDKWQKRRGQLVVQIFRPVALEYGDVVWIEGRFLPPFVKEDDGPVSYADYLEIRNIRYILSVKKEGKVEVVEKGKGFWLKAFSFRLRQKLFGIFDRHLTVNEAGLMKAVILGERSHVPKHVNELFLRTGTVHVLAISGFNVGIVAALFLMAFRFFPVSRRMMLGTVIVLLAGYCFLVGSAPSVLRSTIMIIILLTGFMLEKEPQPINTLAVAAFGILIFNPLYLFDIGFQLSFICVWAIFIVSPFLSKETNILEEVPGYNRNFFRWLWHSLALSLAIWLAVAGLIAYYFRIVTPVTILANLPIVPIIGAVIAFGFLLILVELCFPFAGVWVALALKFVLNAMIAIVFLFDQLPWSSFFFNSVTHWHLIIYYALLLTALIIVLRINVSDNKQKVTHTK
ncbi:MAG TPA: ComEC/Rec2 family competence protein [Candidatus Omnitrophota bacterium]|nr:ComEC/Rec2 family competence protein [Candidatus Omnitrophota bacterium]